MSRRSREELVRLLESESAIRTAPVREAFLQTHRELFVPEVAKRQGNAAVYRDEAFATRTDPRGDAVSSSSQPSIMASMLEELRVVRGHRVLEIGTGTGYNAALLGVLVGATGHVTSVELDPGVAGEAKRALRAAGRRANIFVGDGRKGWKADAPYDRIIVTASSLEVPRALLEQLVEGGLMVLPLRLTDATPFRQIVVTFQRVGRRLRSISVIPGGFMRLRDRPQDPPVPWPVSKAVETRDGAERTIASLSGSTWGRLADRERQHLLALMLSSPRSRRIEVRVSGRLQWDLQSFICLAAPEEHLVGCTREDLSELLYFGTALPGIIAPDRRGLAHIAGTRSVSRVDAYGNAGPAERLLVGLVNEWRRRRRPDVSRLSVEVVFGRAEAAWRTKKRGSSVLLFEYR